MPRRAFRRFQAKKHTQRLLKSHYVRYNLDEDNLEGINFGWSKRKLSDFFHKELDWEERIQKKKQKLLHYKERDSLEELDYIEDSYEKYREAVIEHEDYCYKNNLDPLENSYFLYKKLGYDL